MRDKKKGRQIYSFNGEMLAVALGRDFVKKFADEFNVNIQIVPQNFQIIPCFCKHKTPTLKGWTFLFGGDGGIRNVCRGAMPCIGIPWSQAEACKTGIPAKFRATL